MNWIIMEVPANNSDWPLVHNWSVFDDRNLSSSCASDLHEAIIFNYMVGDYTGSSSGASSG